MLQSRCIKIVCIKALAQNIFKMQDSTLQALSPCRICFE